MFTGFFSGNIIHYDDDMPIGYLH